VSQHVAQQPSDAAQQACHQPDHSGEQRTYGAEEIAEHRYSVRGSLDAALASPGLAARAPPCP
jgi:hypothetical protein